MIHRYPPAIGGAEAWCAGLARWQAQAGHEVRVLTLAALGDDELTGGAPDGPPAFVLGRTDADAGVQVRRCAPSTVGYATARVLARGGADFLAWGHSAELYGVLPGFARAADVVHAHWLPGPLVVAAWLTARQHRRRFVLTPLLHAGDAQHESRLAGWLLRRADRVVVLTAAEERDAVARGVAPAAIIRGSNAIAPAATPEPEARERVRAGLGVPLGAQLVACVTRKAANKGLDVLLDAFARRPGERSVLAVAGPATAWWAASVAGVDRFWLRDLPVLDETAKHDLLAAADVLVLPSRRESFGTVFLEAWSAGTPVIGADIPAVREVIGDAGSTFAPDDAGALAAALDTMLRRAPEERRQMAERGRARLGAHRWEQVGPVVTAGYDVANPR